MDILPKRIDRFKSVIAKRQFDLTVILENVHDPHNIGAVLRTCDSIGIPEVYIVHTEKRLVERGLEIGHKSSSGANQWIDIRYFNSVVECFAAVHLKYGKIYGTKLAKDSTDLYHLDLSHSCALLFGNEHDGVSAESTSLIDGNFIIPQQGFVQSLNISVACAVALYEAFRQRKVQGRYEQKFGNDARHFKLLETYKRIHRQKKIR